MTEGLYQIDKRTYDKLSNDENLLKRYGYMVAMSSSFKPYEYGYFGAELRHDVSKDEYFLVWKRSDKKKHEV